jgi:biopolymer transport protein ExbD
MEFERDSRRTRELNLTPLVDIILMLVIFFMLSTSFIVSESMELSLPGGQASAPLPDVVRIQIMPSGDVLVNQQTLSRTGLNQLLVTQLANNPQSKIAIYTTPGVSVQQLVSILDEVYLTGGTNVQVDKIEYAS